MSPRPTRSRRRARRHRRSGVRGSGNPAFARCGRVPPDIASAHALPTDTRQRMRTTNAMMGVTKQEAERRRTMLVLALASLATLALRLLYVTVPLGVDEGGLASVAKAWGTGGGSIYGAYWLDRPPLLVALYKAAGVVGALWIRGLGVLAALALAAATTATAQLVAGDRAARVAAVLTAALASSAAIGAVFTPAELLAAVPAAASVGCLVAAHKRGEAGWMVVAGLLAVSAALVKQSFLDGGTAGAAFLVATA